MPNEKLREIIKKWNCKDSLDGLEHEIESAFELKERVSQEHWTIFDEDVRTTLCVCFSLKDARCVQSRYKERTKIYHCVEVL